MIANTVIILFFCKFFSFLLLYIHGDFMNKILNIRNITILDIDTSILFTSEYNYLNDAKELINNSSLVVITREDKMSVNDIPPSIIIRFNCDYLLQKKDLTLIDQIKINILCNLTSSKPVFVFMDILTYLDSNFKKEVIKYLKEKNKRIINYTSNIEETLMLEYIIIIQNDIIIMEGLKESVLQEEKIIKKLGFSLPFIVDLSSGLKYYDLVAKIYFDNERLVNDLWS